MRHRVPCLLEASRGLRGGKRWRCGAKVIFLGAGSGSVWAHSLALKDRVEFGKHHAQRNEIDNRIATIKGERKVAISNGQRVS